MKLLDGPDFYGYTIFCDDIRHEIGGKTTFVGVYADNLLVHGDFPVILPKFCFGVTCIQKASLFIPPSRILIFLPHDPEDTPSIVAEASKPSELEQPTLGPHGVVGMSANLVVSGLKIEKAGHIKVRVVRNDEMVRCGALKIQKAPASHDSSK